MSQTELPKSNDSKVLFDLLKNDYEKVKDEFYKIEDKISKHLTFLGILVTISLFILKEALSMNLDLFFLKNIFYVLVGILVLTCLATMCYAVLGFKPVKLNALPYLKLKDYFYSDSTDAFYCGLCDSYIELIQRYMDICKVKSDYILNINRCLLFIIFLLALLLLLFFFYKIYVSN